MGLIKQLRAKQKVFHCCRPYADAFSIPLDKWEIQVRLDPPVVNNLSDTQHYFKLADVSYKTKTARYFLG